MSKHAGSIDDQVQQRIQSQGLGWVFTPADFADLGSRTAVASTLSRSKAAGTIRLLGRGLYDTPVVHPVLGLLWPAIESVAKALDVKRASGCNHRGFMRPICWVCLSRCLRRWCF